MSAQIFDLSAPDVSVMRAPMGGGWAFPETVAGREALEVYFGEPPAPIEPVGGTQGYIVEPYDTGPLAEHLLACKCAWKVV